MLAKFVLVLGIFLFVQMGGLCYTKLEKFELFGGLT